MAQQLRIAELRQAACLAHHRTVGCILPQPALPTSLYAFASESAALIRLRSCRTTWALVHTTRRGAAGGCDRAEVVHKPRLLSDNGSSYISNELADWITDNGMSHVRGAPYHPQTQGKIERWHQTLKNRILLEHYFLPGDLEKQIEAFVDHYNHQRYHESLKNLTPADVYFGRGQSILASREKIKKRTIAKRRLHYQRHAA